MLLHYQNFYIKLTETDDYDKKDHEINRIFQTLSSTLLQDPKYDPEELFILYDMLLYADNAHRASTTFIDFASAYRQAVAHAAIDSFYRLPCLTALFIKTSARFFGKEKKLDGLLSGTVGTHAFCAKKMQWARWINLCQQKYMSRFPLTLGIVKKSVLNDLQKAAPDLHVQKSAIFYYLNRNDITVTDRENLVGMVLRGLAEYELVFLKMEVTDGILIKCRSYIYGLKNNQIHTQLDALEIASQKPLAPPRYKMQFKMTVPNTDIYLLDDVFFNMSEIAEKSLALRLAETSKEEDILIPTVSVSGPDMLSPHPVYDFLMESFLMSMSITVQYDISLALKHDAYKNQIEQVIRLGQEQQWLPVYYIASSLLEATLRYLCEKHNVSFGSAGRKPYHTEPIEGLIARLKNHMDPKTMTYLNLYYLDPGCNLRNNAAHGLQNDFRFRAVYGFAALVVLLWVLKVELPVTV